MSDFVDLVKAFKNRIFAPITVWFKTDPNSEEKLYSLEMSAISLNTH